MDPECPITERKKKSTERHNETVVDPYQWLETENKRVNKWTEKQNEYVDKIIDSEKEREIAKVFSNYFPRNYGEAIKVNNGRCFQKRREKGDDLYSLYSYDLSEQSPERLVNPNKWDSNKSASIEWFVPSEDGDLITYGVDEGGTENYDLVTIDVDSGTVVSTLSNTGRTTPSSFAWTDSGFYYLHTDLSAESQNVSKRIRHHRPADSTNRDVHLDLEEGAWPQLDVDEVTGQLAIALHYGANNSEVYLSIDERLAPVITEKDSQFRPIIHDGTLYCTQTTVHRIID